MSSTINTNPEYIIPDLLAAWPWHRAKNPALDHQAEDEANAWVASLDLFEPPQLKKFKACEFNLLASLVGPIQGREYLRISCDLMNFYFAFDEYTDVVNEEEATKIALDVMNAFQNQPSSLGNSKITEMARQFFERTIALVGNDTDGVDHFIADFDAYAKSIIQEADDRVNGHIRSVEEYFILRRDTCGGKPSFSFFGLGLFIPKEVFEHPLMISLTESATDLIAMTNDLHSYALEHARGLDGHNVITAIMHEHELDLQGALFWLSGYASKTVSKFLNDRKNLPSWGEKVDIAVEEYINRMARCVRGYDAWSYETNRYYGSNGAQVQKTRRITLKPREVGYITREQMEIGAKA
ncbi:terpenoid synthase [Pholiota conissans]|uniref:Terpene synthase n=1 Tax=Pholiota conissans TaxID=109636 RepID=A0A9P6CU96_9AGAR|nr:terpenoid synthase [Pholiota conissans]